MLRNFKRYFEIRKLKKNITPENLSLLLKEEQEDVELLIKLYDWQEQYNWMNWNKFKNNFTQCSICKSWDDTQCICYAR